MSLVLWVSRNRRKQFQRPSRCRTLVLNILAPFVGAGETAPFVVLGSPRLCNKTCVFNIKLASHNDIKLVILRLSFTKLVGRRFKSILKINYFKSILKNRQLFLRRKNRKTTFCLHINSIEIMDRI